MTNITLINITHKPKLDNDLIISWRLYRNPIYPPVMIVEKRISHRYNVTSLEIDQKIDKPEKIKNGRMIQFLLRLMRKLDKIAYRLRFQMQIIAKINHNIVLMSTNCGSSQNTPKNAVMLENKSAKNASNNFEDC
jgi:hypothetical protein